MFFRSFIMYCHGGSVQYLLFAKAKSVLIFINLPFILPALLFAWIKVAMSLLVHIMNMVLFLHNTVLWVQNFFCIHDAFCLNTKSVSLMIVNFVRPVISSLITHCEGFSLMRCILAFFYVVKFILHVCHILRFYHLLYMFGPISSFSINMIWRKTQWIICYTKVSLNLARLINMRFSVFPELIRGPRNI